MARVTIDSGPVSPTDAPRDVPQERWFQLMQVRRDFLGTRLPYDCRQLLAFVDDAEQMFEALGFASPEDFIRNGLGLDLEDVDWAVTGLRQMQPDEPIPYAKAIEVGKLAKQGRPRKGEGKGDAITFTRGTTGKAYIAARLARDRPDLLAKAEAGELSWRKAAIEAGIIKPPSLLAQFDKLWAKADEKERAEIRRRVSILC